MNTNVDRSKEAARHSSQTEGSEYSAAVVTRAPTAYEDEYDFYIYGDENEDQIPSKNASINMDADFDEKDELVLEEKLERDNAVRTLVESAIQDEQKDHDNSEGNNSKSDSEFVEITPDSVRDSEKCDAKRLEARQSETCDIKLHSDERKISTLRNVRCVCSLDSHVSTQIGQLVLTTHHLIFLAEIVAKNKSFELDSRLQLLNLSNIPNCIAISLASIYELKACKYYI
jgi:hypothetical protein